MKNKLFAGLAALVIIGTSCPLPVVNPRINRLTDVCFNLLFDAKKMVRVNDNKMMELWQDHWCNTYGKLEEDITKLRAYIIKQSD